MELIQSKTPRTLGKRPHLVNGVQEAVGSNPISPTSSSPLTHVMNAPHGVRLLQCRCN